ncbi:hypothetical protein DKX38_011765 [Salix brachista]|uniref:Uncharacterized protein n=1 Tax=Salix brachista TaxID=2182728 RepID=A0A5N5LZV2_9ROSI|nr:hypothetical protein DKX38_011765 [Salix brachista]
METELVNKKLTTLYIVHHCLACPAGTLGAFQMVQRQNAINFNARDPTGRVWEFKLCTRIVGPHKKPVIRSGWMGYVREKGATVDDFIILTMVEDAENGVSFHLHVCFNYCNSGFIDKRVIINLSSSIISLWVLLGTKAVAVFLL